MAEKLLKSYWSQRRCVQASVARHAADVANEANTVNFEPEQCSSADGQPLPINFPKHQTVQFEGPYSINSPVNSMNNASNDGDVEWTVGDDMADELDELIDDGLGDTNINLPYTDEEQSDLEPSDEILETELAKWAIDFNIPHSAVSSLLKVLRVHHPSLPKDPRTLLSTPRMVTVSHIAGGIYHHVGIASCLQKLIESRKIEEFHFELSDIIQMQINIDGLPLFKSSSLQMWPILGLLKEPIVTDPFVIGLFAGPSKPKSVAEYLHEFVTEAKMLESQGLLMFGKTVFLRIHSFVCDAPARSFLKNTKSFSGYYGCDRCVQAGKHVKGRMTFPETSAAKRTDQEFADMVYDEYHLRHEPSPLTQLSAGLVTSFVLDYMHLICLGVMRRLLMLWLRGPLSCRLPARKIEEVSNALQMLRFCIPDEFSRKPRTLLEIDRWKATEFRQFLLFTGPLVLREILTEALYKHFLLLHVAVTCLVSKVLCETMSDYARKLLICFVEHGCKLYGDEFAVYNVHSLTHITDDVEKFGCLDNISCFPFENHLRKLKKTVRKPSLPLQQIVSRLCENQFNMYANHAVPLVAIPRLKGAVDSRVGAHHPSDVVLYSTVHTKQYVLSSRECNNCVWLKGNKIGRFEHAFEQNTAIYVNVRIFERIESFYNYPLASQNIGIVCASHLSKASQTVPLDEVLHKCICMPVHLNKFFIVPLHNSGNQ